MMVESWASRRLVSAEKTAAVLNVKKKLSKGEDIGFVGEVDRGKYRSFYDTLLDKDFLPVICPIGSDDEYHCL